jgi:hypothetical protein
MIQTSLKKIKWSTPIFYFKAANILIKKSINNNLKKKKKSQVS